MRWKGREEWIEEVGVAGGRREAKLEVREKEGERATRRGARLKTRLLPNGNRPRASTRGVPKLT